MCIDKNTVFPNSLTNQADSMQAASEEDVSSTSKDEPHSVTHDIDIISPVYRKRKTSPRLESQVRT